jgi:hypothetical protein
MGLTTLLCNGNSVCNEPRAVSESGVIPRISAAVGFATFRLDCLFCFNLLPKF